MTPEAAWHALLAWRGPATGLFSAVMFTLGLASVRSLNRFVSRLALVGCLLMGLWMAVLAGDWAFQHWKNVLATFVVMVMLFFWAMDGEEGVLLIAFVSLVLLGALGVLYWVAQQGGGASVARPLLPISLGCLVLAVAGDLLTGRQRAAPPASPAERSAQIHQRLDSDDAQDAADKYTRE